MGKTSCFGIHSLKYCISTSNQKMYPVVTEDYGWIPSRLFRFHVSLTWLLSLRLSPSHRGETQETSGGARSEETKISNLGSSQCVGISVKSVH